jgi:YD repeat-containing protein
MTEESVHSKTAMRCLVLWATAMCGGLALPAYADGADEPIPSFYQEPGLSPGRDYVNQHASEHIDPFTGKVQWHFTDLFIPGNGGMDLAIQRSYSSLDDKFPEASPAGYGWTMHFGRVLRKFSDGSVCTLGRTAPHNPVLEMPHGGRQILYEALDGMSFITTNFWKAECNGEGYLSVTSPEGTRYDMNTPGIQTGDPVHPVNTFYVSKITDRNGNWMSLQYSLMSNTVGVTGITTSDGRSVSLTYNAGMIKTVTDGFRTWDYTVEGGFLTEVKRPDGAAWKFAYNALNPGNVGQASLNRVTYPTGGVINYTYGEVYFAINPNIPRSHVITQKSADGGTWNYAYQPATEPMPGDVTQWTSFPIEKVDNTTVTGPDGVRSFKHIGYTSAPSGGVMHIGQRVYATIGNVQVEATSWNIRLISNQINQRPGDTLTFDSKTYASVFTGKNMNRNGQGYSSSWGALDQFGNPGTITETGTDTKITQLSHAVNTGKWILHQRKDETSKIVGAQGDEPIGTIARTIDGSGNLLSEVRYGVKTDYTYWPTGDLHTKTDARNNTITYGGHHRGIPQSESHPEGISITRQVNDAGNVASETDGENATTSWQFDHLNRPTRITHPLGSPVNVVWTTNTRKTTRGNYQELVTYDPFGRESQVVHTDNGTGQAITVVHEHDKVGRRVFTSYPNNAGLGTKYEYDIVGQLLRMRIAFDKGTGTGATARSYFRGNDLVTFTNERGKAFVQKYRAFADPEHRELMAITAPEAAASVEMKRNGLGQITEVKQDGKTRTYVYDTRFFLMSQTDPETGSTTYGRDEVGNMTTRQVGGAGGATYAYDGRNRVASITYGDSAVSRTYYKDDKPQSVTNSAAARTFSYDGNKNMTSESVVIGGQTFATGYAYDGNDSLRTVTYGSGVTINYNPDAFGRPTQALPYVTSVTHHPSGVIGSMTYANGVQTSIGLNTRLWPSSLKVSKGAAIFDKAYLYDSIGNITRIDELATGGIRSMAYDNIDRLTGATGPWAGLYTASYDGRGNIQRQAWTHDTTEYYGRGYAYDADTDRLLTVTESTGTTLTYTHDLRGNVTAKGATNFVYTDASTMRCSNCGTPAETLHEYDGSNMRVKTQKDGVATYFVYGSAGNLLWEQTPGVKLKEYFYLGGKQVATREKNLTPP